MVDIVALLQKIRKQKNILNLFSIKQLNRLEIAFQLGGSLLSAPG
jgi:hypothetical protein